MAMSSTKPTPGAAVGRDAIPLSLKRVNMAVSATNGDTFAGTFLVKRGMGTPTNDIGSDTNFASSVLARPPKPVFKGVTTNMKKKKARKPRGWRKFDDLVKKLIQVPKDEVDSQIEHDKRERAKKRKKKKRKK